MNTLINRRVQVYFNLHKKCFSVRDKKTRLVIAHVDNINLYDVEFKVSEKGRQRVLAEKRKNVHAIVEGNITGYRVRHSKLITYNPYKYDSFVVKETEIPINTSKLVSMVVKDKRASIWGIK